MGGRFAMAASRDQSGKWRKACRELADSLGYDKSEVWRLFDQLAGMREFETRWSIPRWIHEENAYLDCVSIYNKVGSQPC